MPRRRKLVPRELMELAVEVMQRSVQEQRSDGATSPLVGAVLHLPDGTVETACRGEIRDGDHAEFTLLERKHRQTRLDGATLFATLEPCAPGARRHPKLGCAERIVLARIREVYVGVEDPDPKVDRKGIKHLQDHGVRVHMFDRDLQERIRELNRSFFAEATHRAAAASHGGTSKTVPLSAFESADDSATLEDLSGPALERYRTAAHVADPVPSDEFHRRLRRQGLLKRIGGELVPTRFGMMLFGERPRDSVPQAGLLGTIRYDAVREETRDFDGPLADVPGQIADWLSDKLPNLTDRSRMHRRERPAVPPEAVREAVVNALVHRDYDIAGAKCQLVVDPDVITIRSPGAPVSPITTEQLNRFDPPMLSRNPQLHYVFAQLGLAEERGLGVATLGTLPARCGLPLPRYTWDPPYLTPAIYRSVDGASRSNPLVVGRKWAVGEREVWQHLLTVGATTVPEMGAALLYADRKLQRVLARLSADGLVRRLGSGRATRYEIPTP